MLHAQLGMAFLISRQVQIFGPTSLITTLHIIANLSFVQPPQNGGATSLIPRLTETGKLGGGGGSDAEKPLDTSRLMCSCHYDRGPGRGAPIGASVDDRSADG
jgi:hypothetical protein